MLRHGGQIATAKRRNVGYNRDMSLESIQPEYDRIQRHIERNLEKLPLPIRQTWEDRFDNLEDEQFETFDHELDAFLEKREKALIGKPPELFGGMRHLVTDDSVIQETLAIMHEAEGDPGLYVGEGKTAHVYRDPHADGICYKYVHNFTEYVNWNSVDKEARYLESLDDLVVNGARVPKLHGVIDHPDMKVITMEYLNAACLDKVFQGRRSLPDDFDQKIFFENLRKYVDAMHERGIYHRDLHKGNVLVGPNNTPYIIDFGRAIFSVNPEGAYEGFDRTGTIRFVLNSDEDWIYGLQVQMAQYLQNRAKLAK